LVELIEIDANLEKELEEFERALFFLKNEAVGI
jgi:hypothetical protein